MMVLAYHQRDVRRPQRPVASPVDSGHTVVADKLLPEGRTV